MKQLLADLFGLYTKEEVLNIVKDAKHLQAGKVARWFAMARRAQGRTPSISHEMAEAMLCDLDVKTWKWNAEQERYEVRC